jgi:hypothetical protein
MSNDPQEKIGQNFGSLASQAYGSNGVVFALMYARLALFSQVRFQFRQVRQGVPGDLFGTAALTPLEKPSPGQTTGDLLARAITDVDLAGNAFIIRRGQMLKRLRPDWTTIVVGSPNDPEVLNGDPDAEVIGYIYTPGGPGSGRDPLAFGANQVAHFAPLPDPTASFRGMSWLTPVIREIMADGAATTHKLKFFENAATANMVVTLDPAITLETFNKWVEKFNANHEGAANAYRTLFLGGGANVTTVGSNLQQMDFKVTQGAGETRLAAAAGMHPTVVGLSEGLAGASLNAGNFNAARRLTADKTLQHLWQNFVGSVANIIDVPSGAELWYDTRHVPFLAEDKKDAAEILGAQATSIRTLTDGGYDPDSVVAAVTGGDLSTLKHTGLMSVQMQEPGAHTPEMNGNGKPALPPASLTPAGT